MNYLVSFRVGLVLGSLSLFSYSNGVHAADVTLIRASCVSEKSGPDFGTSVEVIATKKKGKKTVLVATVDQQSIAGSRTTRFTVKYKLPPTGMLGGGPSYIGVEDGENFLLTFPVVALVGDKIVGNITATTKVGELNEKLLCKKGSQSKDGIDDQDGDDDAGGVNNGEITVRPPNHYTCSGKTGAGGKLKVSYGFIDGLSFKLDGGEGHELDIDHRARGENVREVKTDIGQLVSMSYERPLLQDGPMIRLGLVVPRILIAKEEANLPFTTMATITHTPGYMRPPNLAGVMENTEYVPVKCTAEVVR